MMPSKWKLVTPTAYRRPRRPGRRALLVASGLGLSTVVAGLAVLGSIHPTVPQSATGTGHSPTTTRIAPTTGTTTPLTLPSLPPGSHSLVAYAGTYPPTGARTSGYLTPASTPTSAAPPPPSTTTSGNDTYTMTYDSGTVVVIYPGGYDGGGDHHDGGHHH